MYRLVLVLIGFLFTGSQILAVNCPVLSNQLLGSYCAGKKLFGSNQMPEALYDDDGISGTIFLDKCPFFLFNMGKKKMYASSRTAEVIEQTPAPWNRNTQKFLSAMKIDPAQRDKYEAKLCKYELKHETGSKQVKQAHIFVVGQKISPTFSQQNQEPMNEPFMNQEEPFMENEHDNEFGNNEFNPVVSHENQDEEFPENGFPGSHEVDNTFFNEEEHFGENENESFAPPPPPSDNEFGEQNYFDGGNTPPPPPPPGNGWGVQQEKNPNVETKTNSNNRGFLSDINQGVGKNLKHVEQSDQPLGISENQPNSGNILGEVLEKRRAALEDDNFDEEDVDTDFSPSNHDTSPMISQQPVVEKQPLSRPIVGTGKKWTAPKNSPSSKGDLLGAIQKGKELKKVGTPVEKKLVMQEDTAGFNTDLVDKAKKQNKNTETNDNDSDDSGWDD